MFARIFTHLVVVFGAVNDCESAYNPSDYVGNLRVPTNCKVEQLNCPRSWKSGVPQGGETSAPMIYQKFLHCHEGFTSCGYVPIDPKTGKVLRQSGVTIGGGVDLGSKSSSSFASLSSTLVHKVEPYFGLKTNLAACAAIERPLKLTQKEANDLTDDVMNDLVDQVSNKYNKDIDEKALVFTSLPRGIRTAIVSVWYQFGTPSAHPNFWGFVTKNDWKKAVNELRNFYSNPKEQASGDLRRRNNEADIIEAAFVKCDRSIDVVFLLDESGSVGALNFQKSLDFVKNIIKAFSNDRLSGEDGTRFGLSTFASSYSSHFFLSNYRSQSQYLSAISRVAYNGGGTSLGRALQYILTEQLREDRGLRPEVDGIPRILIILTDGKSQDNVLVPAQNVRNRNIAIYAIGVAGYNLPQLEEIATSKSHVYTLDTFTDLATFISTLTSSTCYEPSQTSLNKKIKTSVAKESYQYFSYKVNVSSNLEIQVTDFIGSTLIYASRTNPHPYKYDHDISFSFSGQKRKVIIISPLTSPPSPLSSKRKRSTDEELTKDIYVSVTSDTDSAEFTIQGNECNPLNCPEGTNEITPSSSSSSSSPSLSHTTFATSLAVVGIAMLLLIMHMN